MKKISHYDLSKITAERFFKDSDLVLFEYGTIFTPEEPDVLCFRHGYTTLFEIKVSRSDFLSDKNKECRIKYKNKFHPVRNLIGKTIFKNRIDEFRVEAPHLGGKRYYVCPSGLIQPEEVGDWGLYWYSGRFFKKKESKKFRRNIHQEIILSVHAIRRYKGSGRDECQNILVRDYGKD